MRRCAALLALAAAACQQAPQPAAQHTEAPPATTAPVPAATPPALPRPVESRDPARVLLGWARAVSLRDWPAAYAYWGEHGAASGETLAAFSARWSRLGDPQLAVHPGRIEGAAGSSFYTARVTITDGPRRLAGTVVLRRVNGIEGASAEQLRWHIERSTLRP